MIGIAAALPAVALLVAAGALRIRSRNSWPQPRWWAHGVILGLALALALSNPAWFPTDGVVEVSTPGAPDRAAVHWSDQLRFPGYSTLTAQTLPERVDSLNVKGAGLPSAVLAESDGLPIASFEPPDFNNAFVSLSFPTFVELGQPVEVSGRFVGEATDLQISLGDGPVLAEAAHDRQDSAGEFSLAFAPRAPGVLNLRIAAVDGTRSIGAEDFAIDVRPPAPIGLQMEWSRPSFEGNALRSWLADQNIRGQVRIQLAPGIERVERLTPNDSGDPLPPDQLDLWIGDADSWRDWADVLAGPIDRGLGVIILASEFEATEMTSGATLPIRLHPTRTQSAESVADELHATWFINDDEAASIPGTPRHAIGWIEQGQGRIAVVTLSDSHRLLTGRGTHAFAELWTPVFNTVMRQRDQLVWHRHTDLVATPGMRTTTCVMDASIAITPAPIVSVKRASTSPLRCTDWWPRQSGWHRIDTAAGAALGQVPVLPVANLAGPRRFLRAESTRFQQVLSGSKHSNEGRRESRPAIWWWLFAALSTAIWLREKASDRTTRGENMTKGRQSPTQPGDGANNDHGPMETAARDLV